MFYPPTDDWLHQQEQAYLESFDEDEKLLTKKEVMLNFYGKMYKKNPNSPTFAAMAKSFHGRKFLKQIQA